MNNAPRHAGFMRRQAVAYELGITRHTLARMIVRDSDFPRFFEITPGIEVIERADFDRWIARKKIKARRKQPTGPTISK